MNANVEAYAEQVYTANTEALEVGHTSMARSLPCLVCRELEPLRNPYVESIDKFMTAYRALPQQEGRAQPVIPRKIEFESAVYLKQGIIDRIFPDAPVTVLFIGDGRSDMRFSQNCRRLFETFGARFQIYSFICNPELASGDSGWASRGLFYLATSWADLPAFMESVPYDAQEQRLLLVVDIDGTYLCPRPDDFHLVHDARKEALKLYTEVALSSSARFDPANEDDISRLQWSYDQAASTGFCRSYDDADLTALVALGIYVELVDPTEDLLQADLETSFTVPIEWLRYATFRIGNSRKHELTLLPLQRIYTSCLERILDGAPTIFPEFRTMEGRVLSEWAEDGRVRLNREISVFLRDSAERGGVAIGYSDRPNASLGLASVGGLTFLSEPTEGSLVVRDLSLTLA